MKKLTFGQFVVEEIDFDKNIGIRISDWMPPITSVECNGTIGVANGFKWIKQVGLPTYAVDLQGNSYAWHSCAQQNTVFKAFNKEGTCNEVFANIDAAIIYAKYHDHLDSEHIDRILLRTPE